jgi:hypothetical protein
MAKAGDAEAIAMLNVPPCPESVAYLLERAMRLHGMREFGMHGPLPFTPTLILHGAQLFGWSLLPSEAVALVQIGHALLAPGDLEVSDER